MRRTDVLAVLSPSSTRARVGSFRQTLLQTGALLLLLTGAFLVVAPAALALGPSSSQVGALAISQTAVGRCLPTPSATITLPRAVTTGDELLLMVGGQGYRRGAPTVTSVSDPVNGQWSPLINDKSETLDGVRRLSYAVYDLAHAKAAPSGLKVTIVQQRGQSAAGAVLVDISGPVSAQETQFQQTLQASSSQNTLTSPTVNATAGQLAVGLFGAYNVHQGLSGGAGWTVAATAAGCTRTLAESRPVATSGPMTAGATVSGSTYYIGGLITFSSASTTSPPASSPVDKALPTVNGAAQVGDTLAASSGSWANDPTSYTYQWRDCTSATSCSNISGATSSSYSLRSSDVGKTIDIVVTATNAAGSASATSAQTATVQTAPMAPPINMALPAITGTAQVGSTLTASSGSWANSPASYAYQWQDCATSISCTSITGATSSSYTLQPSDVGKTMDVVVTATNAGGSGFVTSLQTQTIPAPASGTLGSGQVFAHWLAWETSVPEADIPWNDVTQIGLDMLTTNTTTSGCSSNCTTLNTSQNSIDRMDVPAWVSMIHQHGKLAIIDIGGSTDQDWANACNSSNLSGFASELVNWMVSNGFDGVNLDIESLSGAGTQLSLWANCVQAIAQDAHAARTQAGKTPIVAEDVDQSWMDAAVAQFSQWVDQFQLMYYGYPVSESAYDCANGTPVNTCAQVNTLVQNLHSTADIPYSKMLLGMSAGGGEAQCCYLNLGTTSASVNSGSPVSSIQLSSGLSAALPAGEVVLASTENPPAHWEMFTTSGAAQGATSIPITGEVSGSGSYTFPSGSDVQSAYEGPWDCRNFGRYVRSAGLGGLMIWTLQQDAGGHNGEFPCFDQAALGLGL